MNKIIAPIKARCVNLRFYPIDKNIIVNRLKYICDEEKLKYKTDSLEAIANICNGDLRKAINILQSLSMMGKRINIESCYNSAGIPPPVLINELYELLINKTINFSKSYDYINKNVIQEGYTLSFIIQEINKIIVDKMIILQNVNDEMINHLQELSELEYNVSQSIFDDMYMIGLIAIFKKY